MSVALPQHRHCVHCSAPIPEDQIYCSEECKNAHEGRKKKSDRKLMVFYIVAMVAITLIWVFAFVIK